MEGHKAILNIGSGSHFGGAANQDTNLAGAYFGKQFFLPNLGIGFMDKGNLFRRNTPGDQLLADVIIDRKGGFRLRKGNGCFQCMNLRAVQISTDGLCRFPGRCSFRCLTRTMNGRQRMR